MKKIYHNIQFLRIQNDMTQGELADKVGYANKGTISRIEKGEVDLPLSKVEDFAKVLGVTAEHLLGWDEPEEETIDISEFDEDMKNRIKGYVEAMREMKK